MKGWLGFKLVMWVLDEVGNLVISVERGWEFGYRCRTRLGMWLSVSNEVENLHYQRPTRFRSEKNVALRKLVKYTS